MRGFPDVAITAVANFLQQNRKPTASALSRCVKSLPSLAHDTIGARVPISCAGLPSQRKLTLKLFLLTDQGEQVF